MRKEFKNKKSISLLLGAGFSVPMGYPTGKQLNEKLLNCTGDNFAFHTDGTLVTNKDGTKPDLGFKTSYDCFFDFCRDLIHYYNDNVKAFDYEEFYDYYRSNAINDEGLKNFFADKQYQGYADYKDYLSKVNNIYTQLVAFYLIDDNGKRWYDDEAEMLKSIFPGYTGFLNCIEELSKKYIVNVHTLNHDLFFERLNNTEWIHGNLCDGFEELGSPYYGELRHDNRTYKCRLSRYTGKYDKVIRLYKLHGSLDYYVYYANRNNILRPEVYLKSRYGIGANDLRKERKDNKGNLFYEDYTISYHPDFLTGTTSKISRYKETLLYHKLFTLFRKNLKEAEVLIIIGYGCKDAAINEYIENKFGKSKPCYVVDPHAGDNVQNFISKMGGSTRFVNKEIDNISLSDFAC